MSSRRICQHLLRSLERRNAARAVQKLSSSTVAKDSNQLVSLGKLNSMVTLEFCQQLVEQLMRLTPRKLPFYQQGLRVKMLIQDIF